MRPTKKDTDTLAVLMDEEEIPERDAEFLDSLAGWSGNWTPAQTDNFDRICRNTL